MSKKRPTSKNEFVDKQPHKKSITVKKEPVSGNRRYDEENILWSFLYFDAMLDYPNSHMKESLLCEVMDKLRQIESGGIDEISQNKKKYHTVPISELEKFARRRLEEIMQNDIDELLSVRLDSTYRIWCIRDKALLYILWADPDHKVCPSHLKHT